MQLTWMSCVAFARRLMQVRHMVQLLCDEALAQLTHAQHKGALWGLSRVQEEAIVRAALVRSRPVCSLLASAGQPSFVGVSPAFGKSPLVHDCNATGPCLQARSQPRTSATCCTAWSTWPSTPQ